MARAAAEQCPFWPGHPTTAHWGIPDPAAVEGTDQEQRKAVDNAFDVLKRRIELFWSLPFETLDRRALQTRAKEIGKR